MSEHERPVPVDHFADLRQRHAELVDMTESLLREKLGVDVRTLEYLDLSYMIADRLRHKVAEASSGDLPPFAAVESIVEGVELYIQSGDPIAVSIPQEGVLVTVFRHVAQSEGVRYEVTIQKLRRRQKRCSESSHWLEWKTEKRLSIASRHTIRAQPGQ